PREHADARALDPLGASLRRQRRRGARGSGRGREPGMNRARPQAASGAGFTLIEVMLTLVIMAGIMVTITQILNAARTSRDAIHNIQEQQLAGPAILQQLEN